MSLTLTSDDRVHFRDAQETLLAPLDFESVDAWREAASRNIKSLLGADKAMFQMPEVEGPLIYSDEFELGISRQYLQRAKPLHDRVGAWRRVVAERVWNRKTLWRSEQDAYYQSAYYNDYVVLQRGYHGTGMSTSARDEVKPETIVQLIVHHDNPQTKPFGQRGLMLLRLLYPAFKAGVDAWYRLARRRADLADSLDAAGAAVQMSNLDGRVLHRTPMLTRALAADPQREQMAARIEQVTEALIRQVRGGGDLLNGCLDAVHDLVRTRRGPYRICGTLVRQGLVAPSEVVLVTLRRKTAVPVPLCRMEDRFGLTPRQAEVAQLLAQRKTNKEIAAALCISPHTARHHTEAVLEKLNLHSRTDVRDRIHESMEV